jgi:hypothetical protein
VDDQYGSDDEHGPDGPGQERPGPGGALARLSDRLQQWDDRHRATSFVPASETIAIDVRRHPFLLLAPVLRTLVALVVLGAGLTLVPLLTFAVVTAVWARVRHRSGLRTAATVALGATGALLLVTVLAGPLLPVVLLLAWLTEDVADWWSDRLVVSDKRIYRRYGVVTRHAPSISLTAVAYIDASVPPVGRLLRYGTLSLDSVAQQDAPLSRFDLVPDVVAVSHDILRLRSAAMPRFPPPTY